MSLDGFNKFCEKWNLSKCNYWSLHFYANECAKIAQV